MQNIEEQVEDVYYASHIENVEFTEGELRRMKIAFIDTLNDITPTLIRLGVQNFGPGSELVDHGYTLAQIGPLNNPSWVIYSIELNFEYVSDIWNKKNFYNISKDTIDGKKIVFNKVHLRERSMEEDIIRYIKLDNEYKNGPYDVFSEYIQ